MRRHERKEREKLCDIGGRQSKRKMSLVYCEGNDSGNE